MNDRAMASTIPIRRILLLRPSALGDVCRTVPVLASLRAQWPEAEIHWVVQSAFCPAVEAHPALSGVIPFPRAEFRGALTRPWKWLSMRRWLASLSREHWDIAIDCQGLARTGLMMRASRASVRVCDRAAREGAWLAANQRVDIPVGAHEVDRMLLLAEAAGATVVPDATLYVPDAAMSWWKSLRGDRPEGAYAVLATTSRWTSKAWPESHWIELAERLVESGRVAWIALPGSPSEHSLVAHLASAMQARGIRVVNYAGKTDVGQMMAMIHQGAFTVSNDSAALHMALGLGARCLGLFGPTDPAIVGPWNRPDLALRAPLHEGEQPTYRDKALGDSIMRRLAVDVVFDQIESLSGVWGS
jgi:heptosyltransferase-1